MALALPANGRVVACDVTDQFMKDVNAQQYFKEVTRKVSLSIPSRHVACINFMFNLLFTCRQVWNQR